MVHSSRERGTHNRLLLALPQSTFEELRPNLQRQPLARGKVVHRANERIRSVYFVDQGIVSLVKTMSDGRMVEVGAIGIEGAVGLIALFSNKRAIFDTVVQIPSTGMSVEASHLEKEMARSYVLRHLLQSYAHYSASQVAQTAACNRLHGLEERCCRWLLIAHDSALADTFLLTHEFLAMMLGVQRSSVSLAASLLQRAGFITYVRGRVTIIDRAGLEASACECYRTMKGELNDLFGQASRLS